MYLQPRNQPDPLDELKGEWIGMLTNEIPHGWSLTKFVSPAAKVYTMTMTNDTTGEVKQVVKAKGVVSVTRLLFHI